MCQALQVSHRAVQLTQGWIQLVNPLDLLIICNHPINAPAVCCYVARHMETEYEFKR